jgi:hypothetical protein
LVFVNKQQPLKELSMKKLAFLLTAVALSAPSLSFAQFSSLPGMGAKSAAPAGASQDLGGQQDQLVRSYVTANKTVLNANAQMADALGLQTAAVASKATADSLNEGATKGNLEDANKAVSASTTAVTEALKNAPKLDAEAKAKFSVGLAALTKGVVQYAGMRTPAQDFAASVKSAPMLQIPKLQTGVFVATNLPTSFKNLSAALSNAVSFAKGQGIEVPADATSVLASN